MTNRDWPKGEWADPGARDYLEALGVLSLRYDRLQLALVRLIEVYLGSIPEVIRDQLLLPLNNNQKSNLLRRIAVEMEQSDVIRELLLHFLAGFSICAQNRNIALHADGYLGETHFHFIKRRKDAPFDDGVYSTSLKGLQAICDSMSEMSDFAWNIHAYVRPKNDDFECLSGSVESNTKSIPSKPALPRRLVLPKDGQTHPDGPIFF